MTKDILLDDNLDLLFVNGDLVIGQSDLQHIELIALSNTGDWKENPQFGVNIRKALLADDGNTAVKHAMQIQLEADGADVQRVSIDNTGTLTVEASYGTDN
jgi:hypothetical protein